jgi:hypothetical protein
LAVGTAAATAATVYVSLNPVLDLVTTSCWHLSAETTRAVAARAVAIDGTAVAKGTGGGALAAAIGVGLAPVLDPIAAAGCGTQLRVAATAYAIGCYRAAFAIHTSSAAAAAIDIRLGAVLNAIVAAYGGFATDTTLANTRPTVGVH